MNELETFTGPNGLPTQLFNGKVYQLHPGDPRYFQRSQAGKYIRLHVEVWTFYNGNPPKKHHIHHIDENKHNNLPGNLELKKSGKHISDHTQQRLKDNPEWFQDLARKGQKAAAKWSKTEEGRAFRQKHAKDVLFQYHDHLFKREAKKNCDVCGKEYITTNLSSFYSRFCSNNCKSAWRRKTKIDDIEKQCLECGNKYMVNKYNTKSKFCSRACSALHQHKKNRR